MLAGRILSLMLLCLSDVAYAQLEVEKEILQTIADHADKICGTVPLEGNSGNLELSGTAKAELDGLLKKMAKLGVQGTAKYQGTQYQGVLQKDLAAAMHDQTNCKMNVNTFLMGKLLAAAVESKPRIPKDIREQLSSFMIEGNELQKAFLREIKKDRDSLENITHMVQVWHERVETYLKQSPIDRSYVARFVTPKRGFPSVPNGMPSKYAGLWDLLQGDLERLDEFVSER